MTLAIPRLATIADAAALNRLAHDAYSVYLPILGRAPQPMATDWATLPAGFEIWIEDGETTDAVIASLALDIAPEHVVVWSVAVALSAQHRGIGRAMMAWAETRARALGRRELRLFTNARMTRNVALYRLLGYEETHRETMTDRVLVHMAKLIALPADDR